jgi:hypothetical protein
VDDAILDFHDVTGQGRRSAGLRKATRSLCSGSLSR